MANLDKSRRLSFVAVKRKSMIYNEIFNSPKLNTERFTMDEYKKNLGREKQQWSDILHERKKQCLESKERKLYQPLKIKQSDVYNYISDDNKKFLEDKPDYLDMLGTLERHVKAVKSWRFFKAELISFYDEIQEATQVQQKLLVDKLCSDKFCELCSSDECQNQDHKFPLL